jgi:hypothetical protein
MIDIPFVLVSVLLLWRIPILLSEFKTTSTAPERRRLVVSQLTQVLMDVPYILITLVLTITLYRIPDLLAYIEYYRLSEEEQNEEPDKRWYSYRTYTWWKFKETLEDLPVIALTASLCVIMPHRFYYFFKTLIFVREDEERRQQLLNTSAHTVVDFIALIFLVLSCIMFWRIPFLISDIYYGNGILRQIAARQAYAGMMDIIAAFQLLVILYTVHQLPYTVSRIIRYIRYALQERRIKKQKEKQREEQRKKQRDISEIPEDNGQIVPDEILTEIFTYMEGAQVSKSVETVCQNWYRVSADNRLWGIFFDAFFRIHNKMRPIFKVERIKHKKQALNAFKINFKSIMSDAFVDNKSKYAREYKNMLDQQPRAYDPAKWDYELVRYLMIFLKHIVRVSDKSLFASILLHSVTNSS